MHLPIRFIHTADLHLGAPFTALPDLSARLRQEQLAMFSRLVDTCSTELPDLLLIAGDLFDLPVPPAALVNTVRELLSTIPDTQIFIASGNHDPAFIDSPYRTTAWPRNVHLFTDEWSVIDLADKPVRVLGAGFTASAVTRSLLPDAGFLQADRQLSHASQQDDRVNLLVLHADLVTRGQASAYNPVTIDQIRDLGIDYAALGHRHERLGPLSSGQGWYAYSGCPMGRGFDETGDKGVLMVQMSEEPPRMTSTWIPMASRKFIELTVCVDDCLSHDDVARRIVEALTLSQGNDWQNHYYRISLNGNLAEHLVLVPTILLSRLAGYQAYLEIIDHTDRKPDLTALARESSLRGTFARLLLEQAGLDEASGKVNQARLDQLALQLGLDAFAGEVPERAYP